ncbi:MAG: PEP-utilizing enzyme [Candidatus Tectomicrobia bacterium]|nr:PEP-utilizing enzyme [Candidatus Tectomicrobia bacterium]
MVITIRNAEPIITLASTTTLSDQRHGWETQPSAPDAAIVFTDDGQSNVVKLRFFFVPLLLWLTCFPNQAWAIPSPDIVINVFASLAQVLGLLSLTIGGLACSLRRGKKRANRGGSPWPFRISLALLVVTGISFLLYYGYRDNLDHQRVRANLIRSSTEEGKRVGDSSLKTLSFSEQRDHPRGLSTEQLALWLEQGRPLNLIDVRETEETEAAMIAGAWHRRYPDLMANRQGLTIPGRHTILLCFSGNRSSELCDRFAQDNIPCQFMIGGYEKWLAEGRALDTAARSTQALRHLPDFRHDDSLLDTPEVDKLVNQHHALFVDVRYPGDFAKGHLPDAINIPLRKMPSQEMWDALRRLPKTRPIIAPCYDKRSCFYALVLGLRLDRLGYDFRGRYTVPHEFLPPPRERAHVTAWTQRQHGATFLGLIGKPMQWVLDGLHRRTGSLLLAIFLTVIGLRLLLLPFTVKAEVDRLREAKRAPQRAQLREQLKDHPWRLTRALHRLQREDGVTPMVNMVGHLLQLILFIGLFTVVNTTAQRHEGALLWLHMSQADPYYLLPTLVSGLIFLQLWCNTPKPSKAKLILFVAATGIILVLTYKLSAALNIYLSLNVGLLILHGFVVRAVYKQLGRSRGQRWSPRLHAKADAGIIPLRHLRADAGGGNKAGKLADLLQAGFPVPDGFVITHDRVSQGELSARDRRKIKKAWARLHAHKVAVRSSGLNEDGSAMSYAGVFESKLEVTWEGFFEALAEVKASLTSGRSAAYSGKVEHGGIVVQRMVDAEYAGVLFTEHPATSGSLMVEMVTGLGEALVSGQATPEPYQFGRYSGRPMFDGHPPIDLTPLLDLGKQVERRYGRPQDIEWAYAGGQFHLLQTRDITSHSRCNGDQQDVFEQERFRLLELCKEQPPDEVVLKQNDLSALLPNPTRLSLSMMNRLWESGGTVDLACRRLGIPYRVEEEAPPYVVTAFGSLYVNCIEQRKRMGKGPGMVATFQLSRAAETIEREFKAAFLPTYLRTVRLREALDLHRLSLEELVHLFAVWEHEFVTENYVQAEIINLAAEYYMQVAKTALERRGKDPAVYLGQLPETVVHRAMALLSLIRQGKYSVHSFLELFGHRAPQDFELSMPRYRENLAQVEEMVARVQAHEPKTETKALDIQHPILARSIERARRFQTLKEEAKHYCLHDYTLLRQLLLEIDHRLELNGGIFTLETREVLQLADAGFVQEVGGLVKNRLQVSVTREQARPALEFRVTDLEPFGLNVQCGTSESTATHVLHGLRVSGGGEESGRVRVLDGAADIDSFQPGEILVARFTDPTWVPLFSRASGIITEVGGWLSHAAIVARELGLAGIVDVRDATQSLKTGDLVCLRPDGTVEIEQKTRRGELRYPADAEVIIQWNGQTMPGKLVDISRSGALIEASPAIAEHVETATTGVLQLEPEYTSVSCMVVRHDANRLGISFIILLEPPTVQRLRQTNPCNWTQSPEGEGATEHRDQREVSRVPLQLVPA